MKVKNFVTSLFVISIVIGTNVSAKEITGAEINRYVEKAPQIVPVKVETKANLVEYKMKDIGGKIELEQENIKVEIPKNIVEPVVLKGKNLANTKAGKKASDIKITMPQAKGSKITKENKGVVGYESKDNFTNIVEPTKEGVRLLTVIENKNAPERYEYKLDIKGGYFLTESFGENGKKGIAVLTKDQSDLIAMVDTAWAKDGNGKDIETYYEIKGQTIVQVVKHKVKGTVYPVTADPYVERIPGGQKWWFSYGDTNAIGIFLGTAGWASGLIPFVGWVGPGVGSAIANVISWRLGYGHCLGYISSYGRQSFFWHTGSRCQ